MNTETTDGTVERTLVMGKPSPATHPKTLGPIRARLASCGPHKLIEARMVQLNLAAVTVLTAHIRHGSPLERATEAHFFGQIVPVFVLEGVGVIERISKEVGERVDPSLCAEPSIRYQMWRKFGLLSENLPYGRTYINNFFHVTRTALEASKHIPALITEDLLWLKF